MHLKKPKQIAIAAMENINMSDAIFVIGLTIKLCDLLCLFFNQHFSPEIRQKPAHESGKTPAKTPGFATIIRPA
jgi:hypothetical protein